MAVACYPSSSCVFFDFLLLLCIFAVLLFPLSIKKYVFILRPSTLNTHNISVKTFVFFEDKWVCKNIERSLKRVLFLLFWPSVLNSRKLMWICFCFPFLFVLSFFLFLKNYLLILGISNYKHVFILNGTKFSEYEIKIWYESIVMVIGISVNLSFA